MRQQVTINLRYYWWYRGATQNILETRNSPASAIEWIVGELYIDTWNHA